MTNAAPQDVAPESLGAWDRELNAENLNLLKGHLPTFELFDDVEVVDEKMAAIEALVVETARVAGWRVEHLDAAHAPPVPRPRELAGSKGARRKQRWLQQVQNNPKLARKKAAEIEALKYE